MYAKYQKEGRDGPLTKFRPRVTKKVHIVAPPVLFCRNQLISLGLFQPTFSREFAAAIHSISGCNVSQEVLPQPSQSCSPRAMRSEISA